MITYKRISYFLSDNLFGFRRNRSTSSALLQFTDELSMNMDRGKVSGVIYLDLKKAFDTVNHAILLQKVKWIGVDSKSLQWFQSYLGIVPRRPWLIIVIQTSAKCLLVYLKVVFWGPCFFWCI